jgi:hypothetical protein
MFNANYSRAYLAVTALALGGVACLSTGCDQSVSEPSSAIAAPSPEPAAPAPRGPARSDFVWQFTAPSVAGQSKQTTYPVHLWVSNQERGTLPRIKVSLDGKTVFEGEMPMGDGHTIAMLNVQLPPGEHQLQLEEIQGSRTKVTEKHPFQVSKELWVTVSFRQSQGAFDVGTSETEIGIE